MREIKFRGKRLNHFTKCLGEWVVGDLQQALDGKRQICQSRSTIAYQSVIEVDPTTIGQFTGVLDSDGQEIYEGDIVRTRVNNKFTDDRYTVEFRDGSFGMLNNELKMFRILNSWYYPIKVIGNIHDNPNMLK